MACNLTSGVSLSCRSNVGGLKTAYILDATGVDITVTESAGVVSAMSVGATSITSLSGDMFEFEQTNQTASFVSTINADEANGTVFHSTVLSLVFNKTEATKLNALKVLAANSKLAIVVKDNNDNLWLIGNTNGAVVTGGTTESGTSFADRNGITIEFTGYSADPIYSVTITE